MKLIWDKRVKKWVEAEKYVPPAQVHIVSDFTEAFASPITGEAIHSKAQYQRHLQQLGSHIKEPGDVAKRRPPDRQAIRETVASSLRELGVVR